jgi:hypothetical protein
MPFMGLLGRCIVLLIAVQVVLSVALIALKARRIAYDVVMLGAVCACGAIALGAPVFYTVNGLFLSIVLAELTRYAGEIVHYRREA